MQSKRINSIDICKAIAIICMVLGHIGIPNCASVYIHAFHMPIFFILSGYCFNEEKNRDTSKFILKRFKTLIIPYFIFGVLLFVFWDCALCVLRRYSEMRSITNLLSSLLWNNANASAFGTIQWFLPCLFFSEVIFYFLLKICNNNEYLIGGGDNNPFSNRLCFRLDTRISATVGTGLLVYGNIFLRHWLAT